MALQTEYMEVPAGSAWTTIPNTALSMSIQNVTETLMEYTFNTPIVQGSWITPYSFIADIRQDVYVRFENINHNGVISITRVLS